MKNRGKALRSQGLTSLFGQHKWHLPRTGHSVIWGQQQPTGWTPAFSIVSLLHQLCVPSSTSNQPEDHSSWAGGPWGQQKMYIPKHFICPKALKQCHSVKKRMFTGNGFPRRQALACNHAVQSTLCQVFESCLSELRSTESVKMPTFKTEYTKDTR